MSLASRARLDQRRIFATAFAEPVTVIFLDGRSTSTTGIWHEGAELVDTGDYLQVSSSSSSIVVQRASLPRKPRPEDKVVFAGVSYLVADCEPIHPDMWRIRVHKS